MSSSLASVRKVLHLAEESCAAIVIVGTVGHTPSVSGSMNSTVAKSNPCASTALGRLFPVAE